METEHGKVCILELYCVCTDCTASYTNCICDTLMYILKYSNFASLYRTYWQHRAITTMVYASDVLVFVPDRDGAIPGQSHMARGGMAG